MPIAAARTREIMSVWSKETLRKQSAKATLAEVVRGNGETESRYVCERNEPLLSNTVLIVKHDVEK